MTKTKIFAGVGTLVLACAAFMAAKPVKKLVTKSTAFTIIPTGIVTVHSTNNFTTIARPGHTAFFATNFTSPVLRTLRTGSAGTGKIVYAK